MWYNRLLKRLSARKPLQTVTSAQIGSALEIDPTQVRKDLGAIGVLGMGRVGYDVCEVCRAIASTLGFDQKHRAILVGVGHLGGALLAYGGFAQYGLEFVAAFDRDPRRVGGHTIRATRTMKSFIKRHNIRLAILTTPVEASQRVADRLVAAGIKAIWNFTPTRLAVPDDVLVRNEHISEGLSEIAYHLKE
jgi:redox-sensing transcriptional repressor